MTSSAGIKYSIICIKQVIWAAGGISSVFVRKSIHLAKEFSCASQTNAAGSPRDDHVLSLKALHADGRTGESGSAE